ncbi:uncharacterized protein LOC123536146 isoform X9 [Mercenaria mercenaria]|uniref:uncharacterized protein LOC123536146 isoform X9 n=1 Tax=Mercenaria mercenaria TaxID=6596 RepID=UPI00234E3F11|nr:uncharacterized protein LOC123536146 isoform X9 [Mercenaria mercenaria]
MKPDSLYNYGMKPCMYSEKDALQKKIGWRRHGTNIKYYRNNIKYETSKGDRPFYSLTWSTEFPHKGDTVYFSHCFPYTYTDLQDYLLDLSNDPIKSKICKQRVLCRTLAGNLVYLLTITSPSTNPEDIKHKKAVVLTARVHPGESNASWMMKGFLDYLTSNSADAKLLRDTFIFKIVPMLNPDGVIVGNYRCSLAGRDLNRNYKTVLKDAYPTVWHTKQMIRRLLQEREIVAYCDLHGHSRRQNVFIYGCENRHNPERRLRERIFPCMLQNNSPDKFHYEACKFKIQKSKEGTGRIVMWNMGIMNSYTMEATFCGSSLGKKKGYHFTTRDFEEMGYDFCDTLLDYCDPDTTKCANVLYDLEEHLKQEIRVKLQQKGVNLENVDLNVDDLSAFELESSDGGSDSSVSDGPPVHLQFQPQREDKGTAMEVCLVSSLDISTQTNVPKKKKKLKSKKERDRLKEGKDAGKKSGDNKEKPTIEDSNQRKPLSGHQTSHAKQEKHLIHNDLMQYSGNAPDRPCQKQNAQVRYMQGSPKRPKSHDDRANSETRSARSGASATRENTEEHQLKPPRKLLETAKCDAEDTQALAVSLNSSNTPPNINTSPMSGDNFFQTVGLMKQQENTINAFSNEYLENLTAAYLRKGILQNQQDQARRLQGKGNSGKPSGLPFNMEGLCPHHEQAFAAQLMAQQLQNMTGGSLLRDPNEIDAEASHYTPSNWLQTGIRGQPKSIRPFEQKTQDEIMTRILGMPSVVGNSFVRVWKDYLQKQRGMPPKLQRISPMIGENHTVVWREMNMEELMASGMLSSSSASQTERRSSRHHILEVSEAQKRQELLQQQQLQVKRPEKSASKTHADDKLGGLSSRLRAQIPSATFVNYDTFKISQMNIDKDGKTTEDSAKDEETKEKVLDWCFKWLPEGYLEGDIADEAARKESQGHNKGHKHSGRKSRMGMHDSDDEETKREGPDYVQDPHSHRPPRVKSAKAGGEEINSAIQSIKDLRQSLTLSAANTNLSPTAGNYIKKLLKQELKQTDDDIDEITARLQLNIDEKQKQYDDLMHQANSKEGSNKADVSSHREDSKIRSAPTGSAKNRSNNNRAEKSDHTVSAQVKSKTEKKDVRKTERVDNLDNLKNLKSVTSVNGNVASDNSRLVDAYHLPDSTQHGHNKQEGFRGGKLDSENGLGKLSKLTKVESSINGKSELHYSSATDLSQAQPYQSNGTTNGLKKKTNPVAPRSASSSSSRDESDPKSWSERFERFMDKDKSEPSQRVKSAKNSRQVVGKRFYIQNKYPKRHQPAMNMLKIEGATCTPATMAPVASSPSPTPRSVTSTQLNPLLETIPTKISLMITHDHDDSPYAGNQFLPLSRTVRGTYNKSAQVQPKRK